MAAAEKFTRKPKISSRRSSCQFLPPLLLFSLIQLTQIPTGNAALAPEEAAILEILRDSFGQANWTGDPCEVDNVTWITCFNPLRGVNSVKIIDVRSLNRTGTIPAAISNLRNLNELLFGGNQFTGSIPYLNNMTHLLRLEVNGNQLTGPIPDTSALANITRINLSQNNLSGGIPPSLFQHNSLIRLEMKDNPCLGGRIPGLSNLTKLANMDLENCSLIGTIPTSVKSMTQLGVLYLNKNKLVGTIPDMSGLLNIQWFGAEGNRFTGTLPSLASALELHKVHLPSNDLSGTIPQEYFLQEELEYFQVNNNSKLSGELPVQGNRLSKLKDFYVADCNLSGPVREYVKQWAMINVMELQNNHFTSFPDDISSCVSLHVFKLSNNSINGTLPELPTGEVQKADQKPLQWLKVDNNHFHGEFPASWSQLSYLLGMDAQNNKLSGVIPKGFGNLTLIQYMNLSNNALSGPIPEELDKLTQIVSIDLRNNRLNGTIPEVLLQLDTLRTLRLENNDFTGLPEAFTTTSKNWTFTYDKNDTKLLIIKKQRETKSRLVGIVIGVLSGALAFVLLSILLFVCLKRRRRYLRQEAFKADLPKTVQAFTLKEINAMTEKNKKLIGKGGFGEVYYGKLPDNKEVAVKIRDTESAQGTGEFKNEIKLLSRLHHRNLVPLIGYCIDSKQQILVYQYMSKGTLEDHLFPEDIDSEANRTQLQSFKSGLWQPLPWKRRLDIALNAARGLEYLHKDCNPPVIHRDIKTSNILLTDKFEAKLGDLGISKQTAEADSDVPNITRQGISTAIKGTFGYLDPEYYSRGKLTTKSDVFSFGVVLLEMLTGRRPQGYHFPGETNMIDWVRTGEVNNKLDTIVDPNLNGHYNAEGMPKVVKMALSCIGPVGTSRPDMGDIIRILTEAYDMEEEEYPVIEKYAKPHKVTFPGYSDDTSRPGTSTTGSGISNVSHEAFGMTTDNTVPR